MKNKDNENKGKTFAWRTGSGIEGKKKKDKKINRK